MTDADAAPDTPQPAPDEAAVTFPVVNRLDMGVDPVEDRVFLMVHTIEHGRRIVLLTRRMTRVVLGHIAKVMERTSEAASRAPSDQRQEVLRMEHMGALSTAAPAAPGQDAASDPAEAMPPEPVPAFLATEVKVRVGGDGSLLLAVLGPRRPAPEGAAPAPDPVCALPLDRASAHRLLGLLNDKAEAAQWDLSADPEGAWLRGSGATDPGTAH